MANKESGNTAVLTINIGNDLIKLGLFSEETITRTWSMATPRFSTVDEVELVLSNFFELVKRHLDSSAQSLAEGVIVASVVPALTDVWVQASGRALDCRPFVVGPGLKTGMKIDYKKPTEIGADRIANLVAALHRYQNSVVVVDFGTTTNLSVLDSEGVFCGGIIAPGLRLSAEALSEGAAKLSSVEIRTPSSVIGKTSNEAMQSGIVMGEVVRIDGLIELVWSELGYETNVIATGLDAAQIGSLSKHIKDIDDNLTLYGLRLLYLMNRPAKSR